MLWGVMWMDCRWIEIIFGINKGDVMKNMIAKRVKFLGASQEQTNWGGNDDANEHLVVGSEYDVSDVEQHSYHTKITLVEFPGLQFNSVSFEGV